MKFLGDVKVVLYIIDDGSDADKQILDWQGLSGSGASEAFSLSAEKKKTDKKAGKGEHFLLANEAFFE